MENVSWSLCCFKTVTVSQKSYQHSQWNTFLRYFFFVSPCFYQKQCFSVVVSSVLFNDLASLHIFSLILPKFFVKLFVFLTSILLFFQRFPFLSQVCLCFDWLSTFSVALCWGSIESEFSRHLSLPSSSLEWKYKMLECINSG